MGKIFTEQNLGYIIRFAPILSGLICFFGFWVIRFLKRKQHELSDVFIVGMAGASIPSGFFVVLGAFDPEVLQELSDCQLYIAFSGASLIYLAFKTITEKTK
jgi:hypothetical protein